MGTLLALMSALSYGLSDFWGGIASRRVGFERAALLGQLGGLAVTALAGPLVAHTGPHPADLGWGALSGVGTGIAMTFLFRGISRGAMSVVVPISAVGGAALPVLLGTAVLGEQPTASAWAGIALAVPALWLVAGGATGAGPNTRAAVGDGLIAGVGIAVQYLALARAAPASGIWPVAAGRAAAVVLVALVAWTLASGSRDAAPDRRHRADLTAVLSGVLAAAALVSYLLATRTESLTVAVVLSSLYPIVPVVLGVTALRERLHSSQIVGLVAALVGSTVIATS
ncbi:EamA family transporter [Nocardia araoensis]|uniref:EamA family transporter n=1 Tax=Nocardia araoensis TaxID=228600 RepID=UPI000584EED2|nr:EamA family transporter [Nocardia araoensis]